MTAVPSNLIPGFEERAARARGSFDLEIQSEEHTIRCAGEHPFASARRKVDAVVDPLDGSTNLPSAVDGINAPSGRAGLFVEDLSTTR